MTKYLPLVFQEQDGKVCGRNSFENQENKKVLREDLYTMQVPLYLQTVIDSTFFLKFIADSLCSSFETSFLTTYIT